ncbi:MAG: hypothetical protein OXH02_03005, partial [Gemmatimonadetes bacterium]|nr:hypothetical protein [Gemmatimonadota bacterium]
MKRLTVLPLFCLVLLAGMIPRAAGAQDFEYWPGTEYDPAVPTAEEVLGYRIGDRITPSAGLIEYLEALESAV